PSNNVGHHGGFAADQRDIRPFGASCESVADFGGDGVIRFVDREVVNERYGFDAGGHEVVRVHRHAVDPHGRIVRERLGDEEFRADAVGGECEILLAEVD